jgi:uncharacterized protein (TIGR00369 family)
LPGSEDAPDTPLTASQLQDLQERIQQSPFSAWTGLRITAYRRGFVEGIVPFRPELTQHHGFLHGAVVGYMIDTICAWAASSIAGDVLTSEYRVHLLAPGIGNSFLARGEVVKALRRQIVSKAEVFALTGGERKLIAFGTATIMPARAAAEVEDR